MLDAAVKAISQILSPPMRTILWRSIGLALVLITVLAIGLQRALSWFADYGEGWAEAMLGPGFHTTLNILSRIISIAAGSVSCSAAFSVRLADCERILTTSPGASTQTLPAGVPATRCRSASRSRKA
jgi:uncharacterized protein involved in cysteine biosynthesis